MEKVDTGSGYCRPIVDSEGYLYSASMTTSVTNQSTSLEEADEKTDGKCMEGKSDCLLKEKRKNFRQQPEITKPYRNLFRNQVTERSSDITSQTINLKDSASRNIQYVGISGIPKLYFPLIRQNLTSLSHEKGNFRTSEQFTNCCYKENRFRIPEEVRCLKGSDSCSSTITEPKKRSLVVNIWEEFYYGLSVLDDQRTGMPGVATIIKKIYSTVGSFASQKCVRYFVFFIFFAVFFLTCLCYNMFWELIGYIVLMEHLQIHELAYKKNINVRFTGSAFQGPAYFYVRQVWCAHCAHESSKKITLKLMDNYRKEFNARKR